MRHELTPDRNGYEKAEEVIPRRVDDDYPSCHVDVTVVRQDRSPFEGTLLRVKGSLNQDSEEREEMRYNGLDMLLRSDRGHTYVWADPDTGGPSTMKTYDWEGNGTGRYKYPIKKVIVEVDESRDPTCPRCDTEMVFGYSEERDNRVFAADGSRGEWTCGWLCPECFPGRIRETERLP